MEVDGEAMEFMVWDTAGQEDYDRSSSGLAWLLTKYRQKELNLEKIGQKCLCYLM